MIVSCSLLTGRTLRFDDADRIAAGGEGAIYPVDDDAGLVAKIYKEPKKRSQAKLEAMLRAPPDDDVHEGHVSIAWPTDVLLERKGRGLLGFLMKRVPKAEAICAYVSPKEREHVQPGLGRRDLYVIAANLAAIFHALHRAGYVVGDVNDRNLLVAETCLISIVDTDSFQVRDGSETYRCPVGSPEFTPPESQGRQHDLAPSHDRFGLAVLLFKLLMEGFGPFEGVGAEENDGQVRVEDTMAAGVFPFRSHQSHVSKPPLAPELSSLDPELERLFAICFGEGLRSPQNRPSARKWHQAIISATKKLRHCDRRRAHVYGRHLSSCPYCERDDRIFKLKGTKTRTARTTRTEPPTRSGLFPQVPLPGWTSLASTPPASSTPTSALGRTPLFDWLNAQITKPKPPPLITAGAHWTLTPARGRQLPGESSYFTSYFTLPSTWIHSQSYLGFYSSWNLGGFATYLLNYQVAAGGVCSISGHWSYDDSAQILSLYGTCRYDGPLSGYVPIPPPHPLNMRLQLSELTPGIILYTDLNDGSAGKLTSDGQLTYSPY
jgi:hypothetical protein